MSSPFKPRNFSSPVNLNEEDGFNVQKAIPLFPELLLNKRPCSNSSINSSAADNSSDSRVQSKRRKIEKPTPTVMGKKNDCFCWICHREDVVLECIGCKRAYHIKCAGENGLASDWGCPECMRSLSAENMDTRSTAMREMSLDKLCCLLQFSLNNMKQWAPAEFHLPVSIQDYPAYLEYIINPMDFSLLEKNIKQKMYGSTEGFLSDVKWILHNSCVFNGSHHILSTKAKSIVQACDNHMKEIEECPDCFIRKMVHDKYWFSEVCYKPHPLVWARVKGFPYWPAKVIQIGDGKVDVRMFGTYDRAWVPISQCYHLSEKFPSETTPKKKVKFETALKELSIHIALLIQKFGSFEHAPYHTSFDPFNKKLVYHGINLDQLSVEFSSTSHSSSPVTASQKATLKADNSGAHNRSGIRSPGGQ